MNKKEKALFKALCKFEEDTFEANLLAYASPEVLGHLFANRMQGVALGTLKKHQLLGKVNREFRNSLSHAHEQNTQKNESFYQCIAMLNDILLSHDGPVAMLKGAYLCSRYPVGYRTSNDIDLLVSASDVTAVGKLLSKAGFVQGSIHNGEFAPATRQEIISSRMLRGETVPYIKEVGLPFMKFFEVDINFSLDYKNETDNLVEKLLSKVCRKQTASGWIPTLCNEDFFIHLCSHLYKEATTLPWIKMGRDMTLYKYCDIYMLLTENSDDQMQQFFQRSLELGLEKICAYAILETMELFELNNTWINQWATQALADAPSFRLQVTSPAEKKLFQYQTQNASKRFFMKSRITDLKEV